MGRDRYQDRSIGVLHKKIQQSRVLLVGAGGIGCELLKDLVKSGYGEIHIIDLDTIDLSNLNRQFLFRHEHIKKPKALVAKEVAQKFDPRCKLVAHHANIKDTTYDLEWFSTFEIVFNALDNLDARRHVNKMCLAADIPLIESGTTGFNGNVQVIRKGVTSCYECKEKQIPKSFPVCTVRSTPSQPIHTIVWAKSYLLPELFGLSEDAADVDATEDSENAEEIKKLKEETEELRNLRDSLGSDDFAERVFDKAYRKDVERLLSMEDYWKDKKAPTPLKFDVLKAGSEGVEPSISKQDQEAWSKFQNFVVFQDSLSRLSKRLIEARKTATAEEKQPPHIEFDKDDEDTLDFVTAAANLRSTAFEIDLRSKFDTKQMAGNIIPAIATTNAMTAALCTLQAYKVMRNEYNKTKEIFLQKTNLVGDVSDRPNPDCAVCSLAMARVQVDTEKATLQNLVDTLKADFGYGTDFNINHGSLALYDYMDAEDDEEATQQRLATKLTDLDVKSGALLSVHDDEGDEPRTDLMLFVESVKPGDEGKPLVKILQKDGKSIQIPRKARKAPDADPEPRTNGTEPVSNLKRKRELDDDDVETVPVKKIQYTKPVKENGPIVLDDDDESGAIVLD